MREPLFGQVPYGITIGGGDRRRRDGAMIAIPSTQSGLAISLSGVGVYPRRNCVEQVPVTRLSVTSPAYHLRRLRYQTALDSVTTWPSPFSARAME